MGDIQGANRNSKGLQGLKRASWRVWHWRQKEDTGLSLTKVKQQRGNSGVGLGHTQKACCHENSRLEEEKAVLWGYKCSVCLETVGGEVGHRVKLGGGGRDFLSQGSKVLRSLAFNSLWRNSEDNEKSLWGLCRSWQTEFCKPCPRLCA